ncbi:hypothetical protein ROZALSC1DRAFT_30471, partial [Rozella allomycis CSF55]
MTNSNETDKVQTLLRISLSDTDKLINSWIPTSYKDAPKEPKALSIYIPGTGLGYIKKNNEKKSADAKKTKKIHEAVLGKKRKDNHKMSDQNIRRSLFMNEEESDEETSRASSIKRRNGHSTKSLMYVNFNQDFTCFSVGDNYGFKIFNTDPMKLKMDRGKVNYNFLKKKGTLGNNSLLDLKGQGIGIIEMLFRTNYLALVGGGDSPYQSNNKVLIWDDLKTKCVIELEFKSEIKSVKMRRD